MRNSGPDQNTSNQKIEVQKLSEKAETAIKEYPSKSRKEGGFISNVLKNSAEKGNILVVGYSPTGGGHTGRSLNIVHKALKENKLDKNSTVILHAPSKWMGKKDRPQDLAKLTVALQEKGVNVILAEATKSVQGYIRPDGSSDDPEILKGLSKAAQRTGERITDLDHAECYRPATDAAPMLDSECRTALVERAQKELDILVSMDAKELMDSLQSHIGDKIKDVKVLTDMDPALQKAARQAGVLDDNRVDQQNHAILLSKTESNCVGSKALLAKVLSGNREKVAHIGLGDKNSLQRLTKVFEDLDIQPGSKKSDIKEKVSQYIVKNAYNFKVPETPLEPAEVARIEALNPQKDLPQEERTLRIIEDQVRGALFHENIKNNPENAKNIVYVYAHGNQNKIAEYINARMKDDPVKDHYKETLFVFCGKDAVLAKDDAGKMATGIDAMSMAYIADGDGITTMGAGTNGEYAFMHDKGGSDSRLLALPIQGHDEQKANANNLEKRFSDYVKLRKDAAHESDAVPQDKEKNLTQDLDDFIKKSHLEALQKKYDVNAVEGLTEIIKESGYVEEAYEMLFSDDIGRNKGDEEFRKAEIELYNSPLMRANRKFVKMMFQAFDQMEKKMEAGGIDENTELSIKITSKESATIVSIKELREKMSTMEGMLEIINKNNIEGSTGNIKNKTESQEKKKQLEDAVLAKDVNMKNMILLEDSIKFFKEFTGNAENINGKMHEKMEELKEEFGEKMVTGF
ncbi:hypothetical protein HUX62_19185 [Massilia sp. BJB1822]|nr:hypothetical protein [Massilia sp. BJB1822]